MIAAFFGDEAARQFDDIAPHDGRHQRSGMKRLREIKPNRSGHDRRRQNPFASAHIKKTFDLTDAAATILIHPSHCSIIAPAAHTAPPPPPPPPCAAAAAAERGTATAAAAKATSPPTPTAASNATSSAIAASPAAVEPVPTAELGCFQSRFQSRSRFTRSSRPRRSCGFCPASCSRR